MKLSLAKIELSSLTKYALIALGMGLALWLGLTLLSGDSKKTAAARTDKTRCADCGLPLSKSAQQTGECPYCAMKSGGKAKQSGGGSVASGRAVPITMIGLFVVMLGTHLYALYRKRPSAVEETLFHMNCRKCDRRVRYREKQVGVLARCPNCRALIRFPEIPEKAKGSWGVVKGWLTIRRKKVQRDSA